MLDNLNSVNAGQTEVVAPSTPDETTSAVADTQQQAEEVAIPQDIQVQTKADNSKFAEMRRSREAAERETLALKNTNKNLMDALNTLGYEGSETDIINKINAEREGISFEEYKMREEEKNKRIANDPRIVEAQKVIRERQFEKDLQAIKEVYPDVTAESVLDLGETYLNIMKSGDVSPVDAYVAQRAKESRAQSKIPPKIGAVNTTAPAEKEFYTPEEVDKLTSKDLDNPKIMEKIMKSMKTW